MPMWDFKCKACGAEQTDVWIRLKESAERTCECGQPMEKLPPRVSAHFKGRGFHAIDYRAPTRGF
jgi:putative FmdB family regulatory protein